MPAITIFGKEDYGPDEIMALDELFERDLGVPLSFWDLYPVRSDTLERLLGCRAEGEETQILVIEAVEGVGPLYPEGLDPRLAGATFVLDLQETPGDPDRVKQSPFFKELERALGFQLEVIQDPSRGPL